MCTVFIATLSIICPKWKQGKTHQLINEVNMIDPQKEISFSCTEILIHTTTWIHLHNSLLTESSHTRGVLFHLYGKFRIDRSIHIKSRLVVTQVWEERSMPNDYQCIYGFFLNGKNILELNTDSRINQMIAKFC